MNHDDHDESEMRVQEVSGRERERWRETHFSPPAFHLKALAHICTSGAAHFIVLPHKTSHHNYGLHSTAIFNLPMDILPIPNCQVYTRNGLIRFTHF